MVTDIITLYLLPDDAPPGDAPITTAARPGRWTA